MDVMKDYIHHLIGGIEVVLIRNLTVVEIVSTLLKSQGTSFLEMLGVTFMQVMYASLYL